MQVKMPVLYIGHGSPTNAIKENEFTKTWKRIAEKINTIKKPIAILCISAHWQTEGTAVTSSEKPKMIHDFYGFPKELYTITYPAKGNTVLAKEIQKIITTTKVSLDTEWGIDHGTWSVLTHMYPNADIPVLQLSLDYELSSEKMLKIGKELGVLRTKGILIIGSGNLVHNLALFHPREKPFPWVIAFDTQIKKELLKKNTKGVLDYSLLPEASLAHPTNDHYLPLLYVVGASQGEKPLFFNENIIFGSISMTCVAYGLDKDL